MFKATISICLLASTVIYGCGKKAKMELCKFVEIETAEFEVEFGDIDVEGGEVEMVCGDRIVDVSWNQFKNKLRINPQRYLNNLEGFKREVSCLKNEKSKEKIVFCSRPRKNDDYTALKFTYDD